MNRKKVLICDLCIAAFALGLDQIVKMLIRRNLDTGESVSLIPGWLELYHHENTGATWGMLKGQTLFFIIIAVVVSAALIVLLLRIPAEKKYVRMHISVSLILAGALGNTIDRIAKGSVTDFISAVIIHFPIFNVADIFIVCATIWLIIMILFIYKDDDLDFLNPGRNKEKRKKGSSDAEEEK